MSSSSTMTTDVDDDDMQEMEFVRRGCCCIPYFGCISKNPSPSAMKLWERMGTSENKEKWFTKGWRKVREWSELVAGPKWKTFIRRFNKKRANGYIKQGSFQYDPFSYARNFDDNTGEKHEEDYAYGFSSCYASVPASAKSSMDLGKDGPSFI